MKILVTGGRDYNDLRTVTRVLCQLLKEYPGMILVHGGCETKHRGTGLLIGADYLADVWARAYEVPSFRYPAKWKLHGDAAGPIRNQQMIDEQRPDLVVRFPGGRGTADCARRAIKAGVRVMEAE